MLPFFRKIRWRLARDNQFLKYSRYAIGEIVLVVIGILIALQINNWNEERKVREVERVLLNSLLKEMEANMEQLSNVIAYNSKSKSAAKLMIDIYNGTYAHNNHEELDSILAMIQWAWTYNPQMGTLSAIKNSGEFTSIQNDKLRTMISSYEDMSNDALEESTLIRNLIVEKFVPSVNKYVSLNQRLKYLGEEYVVGESKFEPDYIGLLNDREIESQISYIYTWRVDELNEGEQFKMTMERFITTIQDEIGK